MTAAWQAAGGRRSLKVLDVHMRITVAFEGGPFRLQRSAALDFASALEEVLEGASARAYFRPQIDSGATSHVVTLAFRDGDRDEALRYISTVGKLKPVAASAPPAPASAPTPPPSSPKRAGEDIESFTVGLAAVKVGDEWIRKDGQATMKVVGIRFDYGARDHRIRVINDDGKESQMLLASLQKGYFEPERTA